MPGCRGSAHRPPRCSGRSRGAARPRPSSPSCRAAPSSRGRGSSSGPRRPRNPRRGRPCRRRARAPGERGRPVLSGLGPPSGWPEGCAWQSVPVKQPGDRQRRAVALGAHRRVAGIGAGVGAWGSRARGPSGAAPSPRGSRNRRPRRLRRSRIRGSPGRTRARLRSPGADVAAAPWPSARAQPEGCPPPGPSGMAGPLATGGAGAAHPADAAQQVLAVALQAGTARCGEGRRVLLEEALRVAGLGIERRAAAPLRAAGRKEAQQDAKDNDTEGGEPDARREEAGLRMSFPRHHPEPGVVSGPG